jgi:hypothetical protein
MGRRKRKKQEPKEENPDKKINVIDIASVYECLGSANIQNMFSCMEKAEKMIRAWKQKYPEKKTQIHDMFQFLMPTHDMHMLTARVFESHCSELLERRRCGFDLRPATRAELIAILSGMSLKVPLARNYAYLFTALFNDVFGTNKKIGGEAYPGERVELENRMRKKFREEWRCEKKSRRC